MLIWSFGAHRHSRELHRGITKNRLVNEESGTQGDSPSSLGHRVWAEHVPSPLAVGSPLLFLPQLPWRMNEVNAVMAVLRSNDTGQAVALPLDPLKMPLMSSCLRFIKVD